MALVRVVLWLEVSFRCDEFILETEVVFFPTAEVVFEILFVNFDLFRGSNANDFVEPLFGTNIDDVPLSSLPDELAGTMGLRDFIMDA